MMVYRSHYPPIPAHPRWVGAGSAGAQDIDRMVWGWYGMVRDGIGQIGLDRLPVLRKCDRLTD